MPPQTKRGFPTVQHYGFRKLQCDSRASKASTFKAWSSSKYSSVCFSYCQKFCLSFCPCGQFSFTVSWSSSSGWSMSISTWKWTQIPTCELAWDYIHFTQLMSHIPSCQSLAEHRGIETSKNTRNYTQTHTVCLFHKNTDLVSLCEPPPSTIKLVFKQSLKHSRQDSQMEVP